MEACSTGWSESSRPDSSNRMTGFKTEERTIWILKLLTALFVNIPAHYLEVEKCDLIQIKLRFGMATFKKNNKKKYNKVFRDNVSSLHTVLYIEGEQLASKDYRKAPHTFVNNTLHFCRPLKGPQFKSQWALCRELEKLHTQSIFQSWLLKCIRCVDATIWPRTEEPKHLTESRKAMLDSGDKTMKTICYHCYIQGS